MSRASNSLLISDVTTTPIKLKYSASYSNTTICDSGIYAQSALNGPVTVTGSVPQRTLRYWSIRHLFYSNFLTGSYMHNTSSADNSLQSTAASGTFENNTTATSLADLRYFPTESLSKVKIINIPKSSYGEKTSRKSFFLTGSAYAIADDGNGNIYDTLTNKHVGNIIYPQGFAIITNPDYYCAMDGGPFTFPKRYTFDITDNPKTFNPITDAQPDCAPINSASLTLLSFPGFSFPGYTQNNLGTVTLTESSALTNIVGVYKDYYTVKSTYCASSDKQPVTVEIVDCTVTGVTATAINCNVNGLSLTYVAPTPTPTPTATITPTPTPTLTPTATLTPTPTPTATPAITPTPTLTPTPTATPAITPTLTPTPTPTPTVSSYTFSNWALSSQGTGAVGWFGNAGSGTVYGYTTGLSGTTIITGTLTVVGTAQNITLYVNCGGTSTLVEGDLELNGGPGGPYATALSRSTTGAGSSVISNVQPGVHSVTLRGDYGTNSQNQSVYVN